MLSSHIEVTFSVKAEPRVGETVFVVGNCPSLGDWLPQGAKPLKLISKYKSGEVWSRVVRIPALKELEYRYFIGYHREGENEGEGNDVTVQLVESNIMPRKFSLRAHFLDPEKCQTGEAVFGFYNGKHSVDKGCLFGGQIEVHLRLLSSPINMWKARHRQQTYRIKCTALDMRYKDASIDFEDEDSNHDLIVPSSSNRIYVSVLNGIDDQPAEQGQFGTVFRENDYMVFRVKSFEPEYLGYQFDFYLHDPNAGPHDFPKHVGTAYMLPVNIKETMHVKTIPINGLKHRPIGQLTVDYLIVKPLKNVQCDMSVSYARHWKRTRRPLDIGHRGMGNTECSSLRENTLASFAEAGGHGADMVEFDVMLSRDRVPVVYHDYNILLTLKKKHKDELDWFEIPVHELTLSQLQMLKLDHLSEKSKTVIPGTSAAFSEDPLEVQPFPTLRQCFEEVDIHVGFFIELKYPQHMLEGSLEEGLNHYFDRNEYTDLILKEILENAGNRRIVMACFDADVCTMVRMKQNKYPIMFLTQGETRRYPWYRDVRCQSTPFSNNFANFENLLGVCLHTEDLVRFPHLTQRGKDMGQVVFCWGEEANSKETITDLKNKGVDGVIYDRIHELKGSKENVFKMEHEAKLQLLSDVGMLKPSLTGSPTPKARPATLPAWPNAGAAASASNSGKVLISPGTSSGSSSQMDI